MIETKTPTPTAVSDDDSCHDTTNVHEVHAGPKEMDSKPNHRQWILKALEARYQSSVGGQSSSPTTSPQCVKDLVQPNLATKNEVKERLAQIENLLFKLAKKDDEYLDEAKLALGLKDLTTRLVRRRLRHQARQAPLQQEDVGFRCRIPLLPPLIRSGIPLNRKFTKFVCVKQETAAEDGK